MGAVADDITDADTREQHLGKTAGVQHDTGFIKCFERRDIFALEA
jgi:hypothetical protein